MRSLLLLASMVLPSVRPGGASTIACGAAGDEASERRDWQAAIRHYLQASDDPRCAHLRAIYLHNAAIAAQHHGRAGTAADRCAAADYFERVLAAGPSPALAESAQSGLTRALRDCPPAGRPSPDGRAEPSMPAAPAPDRAPIEPPPPTDPALATLTAAPTPPPPQAAGLSAAALDDGHHAWWLFGSATAAAVGAGVAYAMLVRADDTRRAALDEANASPDPAVWRDAHRRHEDANADGIAASIAMYGLMLAGVGLTAWGTHALLTADDAHDPLAHHGAATTREEAAP